MNAVLPPEVARALGLSKPGDSAMIEVTGTQADGGVTVMVEAEEAESESPAPVPQAPAGPAAPPELMAALGM
jgi:hypothetical protein